MSLDIALKIGVGLLGASAISLGGYELHNYLTATLESEFSLMSPDDNNWTKLVEKYEKATSEEGKPKRINGLNLSEVTGNDSKKQKLIEHCKLTLKTSLRESQAVLEEKRNDIKTWCISDASALKEE